jgi:hypothetical protein
VLAAPAATSYHWQRGKSLTNCRGCTHRMQFVGLPGTEVLAEDPEALRARHVHACAVARAPACSHGRAGRDGPRLHRDTLGLHQLLQRLADPDSADFADYTQTKARAAA